jgi:hypothetical protein
LVDRIGQGSMGVVWRARDLATGDLRAVKLLQPEYAADPDVVSRFVRERTALLKFRHPNVVTLYDMIVEGEQLALVTELVAGGDLAAYRNRRGGRLEANQARELTAQICAGLAAAHAVGIVHRDLKPANVLLDDGHVKLADFGVARLADETSLTAAGLVMGTAAYLAPEVIRGERATAACDIYAAGVTLYELLAGQPPFTGHVAAVMHGHLEITAERPADVPERLWELIATCLSKDPAARPSAENLAQALRQLAPAEPEPGPSAVPPTLIPPAPVPGPEPATEPVPVHRRLLRSYSPRTTAARAALGVVALALVVTAAVLIGNAVSAHTGVGLPPATPTRSHAAVVPGQTGPPSTGTVAPVLANTDYTCGRPVPATFYFGGKSSGRTLQACIRRYNGRLYLKGILLGVVEARQEQIRLLLVDSKHQVRERYLSPLCRTSICIYTVAVRPAAGRWSVLPQWFSYDGDYQSTGRESPSIKYY